MRAMVFDRYGEPDDMHLKDVPVPEPQDGEVLIRVGYSVSIQSNPRPKLGRAREAVRFSCLCHSKLRPKQRP